MIKYFSFKKKMSKKIKEDAKSEKKIRALLKLPENRRCINCNSLGPQYVCTTFLTFVCTNCNGIHREFTHRVKSVSMSKFNAEEVSNLQVGGNERARQLYFKSWDSERNSYPDGSNLHKLRGFIKNVYVDRRYTGERDSDNNLPRLRLADKEESSNGKKIGLYLEGFQSPGYDRSSSARGRSARRSDSFALYRDESPRQSQENPRSAGFKRNSARFEVVDDRFREEGLGSGWRSGPKALEIAVVDNSSKPPELRMYVGGSSRSRKGKEDDPQNQITESPEVATLTDSNPVEKKELEKPENWIDPEPTPEPTDVTTTKQTLQIVPCDSGAQQSNSETPPKPPTMTMLEALVFELSPALVPITNSRTNPGTPGAQTGDILSSAPLSRQVSGINDYASIDSLAIVPVEQPSPTQSIPDDDFNVRVPSGHHSPSVNNGSMNNWGSIARVLNLSSAQQHQQPAWGHNSVAQGQQQLARMQQNYVPGSVSPAMQQNIAPPRMNQPSAFPTLPNAEPPHFYAIQSSPPAQNTSPTTAAQNPPLQKTLSGRMELQPDLFTGTYGSSPTPYQGWPQNPAAHGMGYNMQQQYNNYPHRVNIAGFQNSARAANPFDISTGANLMQNHTQFPSMAPLQGSLPNAPANSYGYGMQSSGMAPPPQSPSYMHQQQQPPQSPSYMHQQPPQSPSYMHQQSPSFNSSPMPPPNGAYMGQHQVQMNEQQFGQASRGYGNNGAMYGGYANTGSATNSYASKGSSNPFE